MSAALTGRSHDEVGAVAHELECKWRLLGDFAMVHPSGWTIARYSVYDVWRYLLWEPVNRCTATTANPSYGPSDNVRDPVHLHLHQREMAA